MHLLQIETDLPGDVVVHWGVCRDASRNWELPAGAYPLDTTVFKRKASRILLQPKDGGKGSFCLFTLDEHLFGFSFVLKLNESTWFRCMGNDFFMPLSSSETKPLLSKLNSFEGVQDNFFEVMPELARFTDGIIKAIRHLVTDITSEKSKQTKIKEAQEVILQEIEKLAAEAYSFFRTATPTLVEEDKVLESETEASPIIHSGTGTAYEILCQGFNWESHKSGKWYLELKQKAVELSKLGFTVLRLPPPTESLSPEGYNAKRPFQLKLQGFCTFTHCNRKLEVQKF